MHSFALWLHGKCTAFSNRAQNLSNCLNRSKNEDWNTHAQCLYTLYKTNIIANITSFEKRRAIVCVCVYYAQSDLCSRGVTGNKTKMNCYFCLYLYFSLFVLHSTNLVCAHGTWSHTYIYAGWYILFHLETLSIYFFCFVLFFLHCFNRFLSLSL